MISNASKYAIKSLTYIANNATEKNKALVKDIALGTAVPKPYLSKILQRLSTKNFLSSSKGPGGGFYLTNEQLKTSLIDIIIEMEGKDKFAHCILGFENCDAQNPCPIHDIIAANKEALRYQLQVISLKDLKNNLAPLM